MQTTPAQNEDFRFWLQSELMVRCKRNPRYSLRSFASLLEMDASSVSQIISGKRKASVKLVSRICERLAADPKLQEKFVTKIKRQKVKLSSLTSQQKYEQVNQDTIDIISNWYHFAILELMNLDHYQGTVAWVAGKLSLSMAEAKMALERMERIGLVTEADGLWKRTEKFVSAYTPGQMSSAQKELQKQVLRMAMEAMDDVSVKQWDMTNMTMAIDPDKLPEAAELITKFRRELCAYLESGEKKRVYQLGIQLYPLSKE